MASDRGSYRAIPVVLLDGKDFQRLSSDARWTFVALKMNLGPSGIEVQYRKALIEQLAEQTGLSSAKVTRALDDLEADDWVQFEANVVWIPRQLEFEPSMKPADVKHRKSIQRHIVGLPTLAIVARFTRAYPEWFPSDEFTAPKGLARAIEGPAEAPASTEDRRPKTEYRRPNTLSSGEPDAGGVVVQQVFEHWVKATGRPPNVKLTTSRRDKIRQRLKSFSADQLEKAIDGVMMSEHHRQKPEWTDLVSCFQSDEKVENHIARATTSRKNGALNGLSDSHHGGRTPAPARREAPGHNPIRRRGWGDQD